VPGVYTVQLVVPRAEGARVKFLADVVAVKVYNVRAIHESIAVKMALAELNHSSFMKGRVDERDRKFWKPDHLEADVVFIQDGYLNPNCFSKLDREHMHNRLGTKPYQRPSNPPPSPFD